MSEGRFERLAQSILRCLGEPTEPSTFRAQRGPPFFKSHVIRTRLGEPRPAEAELFGPH
jgi:hypothetical protein